MKTFRQRLTRRVLLRTTIAIAVIVGVGWYLLYMRNVDVVAVIMINRPQYIIQPTVSVDFSYDEVRENQRQLVSSHLVILRALRTKGSSQSSFLKGQEDPVSYLSDCMETSVISPRLIEVKMSGGAATAEARLKLLEGIIDAYLNELKENENRKFTDLNEKLMREKRRFEDELGHEFEQINKAEVDVSIKEVLKVNVKVNRDIYHQIMLRMTELQLNRSLESVKVVEPPAIRRR